MLTIGPENFTVGETVDTYRLALATTVEFTEAVCDVSPSCNPSTSSEFTQRQVASDALDNLLNEVNAIYERELAIRFMLIPDNDTLISTGSTLNDGYTDNDSFSLINENLPEISNRLGSSIDVGGSNEFDIGHVLAVDSGGGLARLAVIGHPLRADATTGVSSPVRLESNEVVPTDIMLTILVHEMGHQFGAEHTFNGVDGFCYDQRAAVSAYEPGSASSIMGYLGICGSDNLTPFENDERYFHPASFDQIQRYLRTQAPDVATQVATDNSLPVLEVGSGYQIPTQTPFTLTAIANDSNEGDELSYSWDQLDLAPRFRIGHYEPFTTNFNAADLSTPLDFLDLYPNESPFETGDQLRITGLRPDGVSVDRTYVYSDGDLVSRLISEVNAAFGSSTLGGATASLEDGTLILTPNGAYGNYDQFFIQINTTAPQPRLQFEFIAIGESVPLTGDGDGEGPLFRSFAPTLDPSRTFPRLPDLLNGTSTLGEQLPTQSRELNFRATVRDNHDVAGRAVSGIVSDDIMLNVIDTGAAFRITSPNSPVTWQGGNTTNVTWDVAGTDTNGIDASFIELSLSLDGGSTYPVLLGHFPNNGSAEISVPHLDAQTTARLRARGTGNIFFDLSDADITIDASVGSGVRVIQPDQITRVGEESAFASDTYLIQLESVPSGNVTVTATSSGQVELSLTGEPGTFASSVDVVFGNTDAATVHARAIDDTVIEGNHFALINHAITATSDSLDYPLSQTIPEVAVEVIDDDRAFLTSGDGRLVGVDFDQSIGSSTPLHWTRIEPSFSSERNRFEDLIDESGARSGFDLFVHTVTGAGGSTASASSLPQHDQSLQAVDGVLFSGPFQDFIDPVGFTWANLIPNRDYEIYVFGLENFIGSFSQQITIEGRDEPIVMNQVLSNRTLMINDQVGSSSRTLQSYAQTVTADEFGTIDIRVAALAGSEGIVIPALAIREIIPSTTIDAILSSTLDIDEGDSGETLATFQLVRSGDLPAATVSYSVAGSGGNPVDAGDFNGGLPNGQFSFAEGQTVSDTQTLSIAADLELEGDERYELRLMNTSDDAILALTEAIGVIQNDDQAGTTVTLGVTPAFIPEEGSETMKFTFTRNDTTGSLTVPFTVSGNATFGSDYSQTGAASFDASSGTLTFADGIDTVQVVIDALSDAEFEGNETIILEIVSGVGFNAASVAIGVIRGTPQQSGIGLYQGDVSLFHLRDSFGSGPADQFFSFGPGGDAGWIPLVGDWDGDGSDTIGLFQPDLSLFHLKNSFTAGQSDQYFFFGPQNADWIPLAGDWDGDGVDTVGLYQPDASIFHLKNSFTSGNADEFFAFGPGGAGWLPLSGDWNGDGVDTIGLYQPDASLFHLRNTFSPGQADEFFNFGPAAAGWLPLVGDWDGDGIDTIGLYQPDDSLFHLRDSFSAGAADYFFGFGPSGNVGWTPLAGDWNGPPSGAGSGGTSSRFDAALTAGIDGLKTNRLF
ncbi:MAG: reprolysin-like metallopeptidase, partial [Planctomycetota bacterium]